ncbi:MULTISPECIES: hydroxymethylbilane synthase [unclassified Nocardiopsis]|uniref:hydroxymethylbilane synthase n=1 Tax=unclassified Nocardiopsis TaxID=2649073 RepID=UPI0013572C13|nr:MULTISPECIES: hydroxymethylbilane synthase [unclassified Nocardiopsis]
MAPTVRVGSRGSRLAKAMVTELLDQLRTAHPDVVWIQQTIMTTGDLDRTTSLAELSASRAGVFASQVEAALLTGEIDVAVHSLKDLPTRPTPGTALAAVPARHDVRDALCGATLHTLPEGARVGTSAPRRIGQLRHARPDVRPTPIRGNVPPRLRHMRAKGWGGLLLAAAGLRRLGLSDQITQVLNPWDWPPSPAQGALGVQIRTGAGDQWLQDLLAVVHDAATDAAVRAERALLAALDGGCYVPIGALAVVEGPTLRLLGQVTAVDGYQRVRAEKTGSPQDPEALGVQVAEMLRERGADALLEELRVAPRPGSHSQPGQGNPDRTPGTHSDATGPR